MNRLKSETSPYLLQHAGNPVDWYPWGKEALQLAKKRNCPIFLSIGYSACHWCHVMEKESFEDKQIAKFLNENFVSIKVDREERPDIDQIYMNAVQLMNQHGGWPLTVFLTPDLKPFYGGTYFPPEDRHHLPGFQRVLTGIAHAWKTNSTEVQKSADQLVDTLSQVLSTPSQLSESISLESLGDLSNYLEKTYDSERGGFGSAPKFFHTMEMKVLLRMGKPEKVQNTLRKIAWGGIYDHVGGGFHRYSTDARWFLPHFEKMLYDNALLADLYLETFQVTQDEVFSKTAYEILNYVIREMTSPLGGFYATQDADSEGEEGKFYTWTIAQLKECLTDEEIEQVRTQYNIQEGGNWEDTNILYQTSPLEDVYLENNLQIIKRKLYASREKRIHPFRDEKILTNWNGLMIHAMALGYRIFKEERFLTAAQRAAQFLLDHSIQEGELFHSFKDGSLKANGFLDDYANAIYGLLGLYISDFNSEWIQKSCNLAENMIQHFWNPESNEFYFTSKFHSNLITRPKENYDGAVPSATAMALTSLVSLSHITGEAKYRTVAEKALTKLMPFLSNSPQGFAQVFIVLQRLLDNPSELIIAQGKDERWSEALDKLWQEFSPNRVVILSNAELPSCKGKVAKENKTTFYRCKNFTCDAPTFELPL